jgi:hypothetical protein
MRGFQGAFGFGRATARDRDWSSVRQFNVFLENRVGELTMLIQVFDIIKVRIVSLTIVESSDCSIIRVVLSDANRAEDEFIQANLAFVETEILVVRLPDGPEPILQICRTLLAAEIGIHYAYTLMVGPEKTPALALHVEDPETACTALVRKGFTLLTEADLDY